MKNKRSTFTIQDSKGFKIKVLNWSRRFNTFCLLDNNNYNPGAASFEYLIAAGSKRRISINRGDGLENLQAFSEENNSWLFGHFGYDVLENYAGGYPGRADEVDFGDGFFYEPEIVLRLRDQELMIHCPGHDPSEIFGDINSQQVDTGAPRKSAIEFVHGISEATYKTAIETLKRHILRGDCYEINFCQHFFARDVQIDPVYYYLQLSGISPNPFAAFYKLHDKYCLCASPERFLKKEGLKILSQPIKGTSKRQFTSPEADEESKNYLAQSSKERAENVMIVDLVRNDFSRVCTQGTVQVKELFGVYSFPQVHQMISTIEGMVDKETRWTDIIKACFPMGSMTGAPKIKVMELIRKYEQAPRGLFSGTIGYVDPQGNFDFNVVIRSLMYDGTKKLISFKAGGGITFNSEAEKEYEESLLKAAAIMKILSSPFDNTN